MVDETVACVDRDVCHEWAHTPWWCLPNYKVGPQKRKEKRRKRGTKKREEREEETDFIFVLSR
jgi:hypothetical protein